MSKQAAVEAPADVEQTSDGDAAVAVRARPAPAPPPPEVDQLPPWKVLLHNDPINEMGYVVATIMELTALNKRMALLRMIEAHTRGTALLIMTHRERAELLAEQFASKKLTVTIEAA